jgi:hypothetical protein
VTVTRVKGNGGRKSVYIAPIHPQKRKIKAVMPSLRQYNLANRAPMKALAEGKTANGLR